MNSLVSQEYWDDHYEPHELQYSEKNLIFHSLFDKYLKRTGTCFEVGCYPGYYSVYLGKKFQYIISGIDKTPYIVDRLPRFFKSEGIQIGHLYHEDFLDFIPEEQYDIVCSFGFIEHFDDLELIFQKHIRLVKPSGFLIITCPNFTNAQYILHRVFDAENVKKHNIASMDLERWRTILHNNNMEIISDGYLGTFDFWVDIKPENVVLRYGAGIIQRLGKTINTTINLPNRWFSPYLFSISKRSDD